MLYKNINFLKMGYYLIRKFGVSYIWNQYNLYKRTNLNFYQRILPIRIFHWPNIYSIDLNENKKCTTLYFKNNVWKPFCYSLIMEMRNLIKLDKKEKNVFI